MLYRIRPVRIRDDGFVESGYSLLFQTPRRLDVGGLYYLRPGKLYRVVAIVVA